MINEAVSLTNPFSLINQSGREQVGFLKMLKRLPTFLPITKPVLTYEVLDCFSVVNAQFHLVGRCLEISYAFGLLFINIFLKKSHFTNVLLFKNKFFLT